MTNERDTMAPLAHRMRRYVEAVQDRICTDLERLDRRATFHSDAWEREGGGGGLTRVIEEGAIFEKGGVNTSAVHGMLPDRMARAFDVDPLPFFATGLSLVIHPRSPMVPTVHANVRYFALGDDLSHPEDQWFGGGADLTPYYPYLDDVQHFHGIWKRVCEDHSDVADYAAFKEHCDDYFYLPHRQEARGVGGIFYDYLRDDPEATFAFSRALGDAFLNAYVPIVERHEEVPFGERERAFQAVRRGRYVEFNLVYDRGTRFGLETRGRTESILMSMPPNAKWQYDWHAEPGSREAQAMWFFQPRDWLALTSADMPSIITPLD